ncbi:MAG: DUF1848 domain-containing protein, partial [Bacillota bacterium]|nr:DUF1848 domain-containing protein [Bacillota bacterium]
MIISASRRTDIPAIYSDWFFNRIKEGYVMVRNPMNLHSVYTLSLKRDVVDCIVFWTKNPARMLDNLDIINGYNYYFQFTLNPYDTGIEANVPKKAEIIDTFKKLSSKIGKNKVIWRYDPILVNDSISIEYHIKYFEILASKLSGYTDKCIISFLDFYKKAERNLKELKVRDITQEEKKYIAANLSKIAESYNLQLETCAEEIDLSELGIKHARCIDPDLIESITGEKLNIKKDKGQ